MPVVLTQLRSRAGDGHRPDRGGGIGDRGGRAHGPRAQAGQGSAVADAGAGRRLRRSTGACPRSPREFAASWTGWQAGPKLPAACGSLLTRCKDRVLLRVSHGCSFIVNMHVRQTRPAFSSRRTIYSGMSLPARPQPCRRSRSEKPPRRAHRENQRPRPRCYRRSVSRTTMWTPWSARQRRSSARPASPAALALTAPMAPAAM